MFNEIFKNKKIIKKEGESILDLTKPSVKWSGNKILIQETVYVSENFEMRPDLISQSVYFSPFKSDLFLKYNGISNPFSIEKNEILIIPNEDSMLNEFWNGIEQNEIPQENKRKSITNISKDKFNKTVGKTASDKNTPNMAKNNDGQFLPPSIQINKGLITFGENIGKPKDECCNMPLSKSEFLSKIIKNRIKNES